MRRTLRTALAGALSLTLALSMFPAQGIAYAPQEGTGDDTEVQVESQEDEGEVQTEAQATPTDGKSVDDLQAQADTTKKVAEVETEGAGVRTFTEFRYALQAFNAAEGPVKLSLLADVETDEPINFVATPSAKKIIDLNGNTLAVNHVNQINEYSIMFDRNSFADQSMRTFELRGKGTIVGTVLVEYYCTLNMGDVDIQPGENQSGIGVTVHQNSAFNMNGGSITGFEKGGVYIWEHGCCSLNDGKITGNKAEYGGGVYVAEHAVFMMNGGEVSNNTAVFGGGVYINSGNPPGEFNMTGGEITDNTVTGTGDLNGGGVYVNRRVNYYGDEDRLSIFKVSGNPVIKNNALVKLTHEGTLEYAAVNNVYLNYRQEWGTPTVITIDGMLTDGADIGVAIGDLHVSSTERVAFTTGYHEKGNTADPGTYFRSDVKGDEEGASLGSGFYAGWNSDTEANRTEAAICLHEHSWKTCSSSEGDTITSTLVCDGAGHEQGACLLQGENERWKQDFSLKLTAKNKTYDGKGIEETGHVTMTVSDDWAAAMSSEGQEQGQTYKYGLPAIPRQIKYERGQDQLPNTIIPKDAADYTASVTVEAPPLPVDTDDAPDTQESESTDSTVVSKDFKITKRPITVKCAPTSLTYNAREQGPAVVGFDNLVNGEELDTEAVELTSGTLGATDAGSYKATFKVTDHRRSRWLYVRSSRCDGAVAAGPRASVPYWAILLASSWLRTYFLMVVSFSPTVLT